MSIQYLPRLIYLASEHRVRIPSTLVRFLPQGELISAISQYGVTGVQVELDITPEQIMAMYNAGSKPDRGNEDEFRLLVAQVMMSELDMRRAEMPLSDFASKFREVDDFLNGKHDGIVDVEEFDLLGPGELIQVPKWKSGLEPFDNILDGFYQGILTVVGKPGNGKTSFLLSLMESCRRTHQANSMWFYETEIPSMMMKWRAQPLRKRTQFTKLDVIRCGAITVPEIIEKAEADPDPNRIIFLDGPDVMAAGAGDQRRFAIEDIYRDLVKLKNKCKLIVVTSQARRSQGPMTQESPAEAWQKTWYTDMMITVGKFGQSRGDGNRVPVKAHVVKNRFGPEGREVIFNYDYASMEWDLDVHIPGAEGNTGEEDW